MTRTKKISFWELPEWYRKWMDSKVRLYLILAAWMLYLIYSLKHAMWAEAYGTASPLITIALAYLIGILPGLRGGGISCLSMLMGLPIVGLAGFLIFGSEMLNYKASFLLVLASVVAVVWLLVIYAKSHNNRSTCSTITPDGEEDKSPDMQN